MKIDAIITRSPVDVVYFFLLKAPNDELYTVQELAEKFSMAESTIKSSRVLTKQRTEYKGKIYFGSDLAIAELSARKNQ